MPDLSQSLQGHDLGHLKIIAGLWGIELNAPDAHIAYERLRQALPGRVRLNGVLQTLDGEAIDALRDLVQHEGRIPWAQFTRQYGELRAFGAARRDRERPDLNPASPTEMLWYRALIARAFLPAPTGPQEYAYIPDDLLALLPYENAPAAGSPLGRPATPAEASQSSPAGDRILDHATTLLAALRSGLAIDKLCFPFAPGDPYPLTPDILLQLLTAAGLLDKRNQPLPEPVRLFLEAERPEALQELVRSWRGSPSFNELRLLPGLAFEGEWRNDPYHARQQVLDFVLTTLPPAGGYWHLASFIAAVHQTMPDFQRPAGDYDSWYIRQQDSDVYLRGFEHWFEVDGAVLHFLICGPLHWLGMIDLAMPVDGSKVSAFRLARPGALSIFESDTPQPPLRQGGEEGKIPPRTKGGGTSLRAAKGEGEATPGKTSRPARLNVVLTPAGALRVPRLAARTFRYQLARFCDWGEADADEYRYQLTPASLRRAAAQGLSVPQLVALLARQNVSVPPALNRALANWQQFGVQARLQAVTVLRLATPEMLQTLRATPAARFLGEPIGPTAVIVRKGAEAKVLLALAELGLLGELIE
jgi:hypothetical protein